MKRKDNEDIEKIRLSKELNAILDAIGEGYTLKKVGKLVGLDPGRISKIKNFENKPEYLSLVSLEKCKHYLFEIKAYFKAITQELIDDDTGDIIFSVEFEEPLSPQNEIHFIFYYSDSFYFPTLGHLKINKQGKEKNAELIIFSSKIQPPEKRLKFIGKASPLKEANKFLIFFEDRIQLYNKHISNKPLFCCFDGDLEDNDLDVMGGVYAFSHMVSSGVAIIERIDASNVNKRIEIGTIPPPVLSIIHEKRFDVGAITDHFKKSNQVLKEAKRLQGSYEVFVLQTQRNNSIHKLIFKFSPTGEVFYKSIYKEQGEKGRIIDFRKGRNLILAFDRNRRENYYAINMILDSKEASHYIQENCFFGIYSEIGSREMPYAGRIIFFKSDKSFDYLNPEIFPFTNKGRISYLFEKSIFGEVLKKFFKGELDKFTDPPQLEKLLPILFEDENE